MSENLRSVIVLTVDGLNPFMLGLYGNTMLETPAFDQLASCGVTFDFAFSHSCELGPAMERMLRGEHGVSGVSVTEMTDGRSVFVTDCDVAAQQAQKARFETIIDIAPPALERAEEIEQTRAALFFSAAIEAVEQMEPGDLLWLHFSGLSAAWDAPLEQRMQFTSQDDPAPYGLVQPPEQMFDEAVDDPDLLVSLQHALMAQVAIIDQLLGVFLQFIQTQEIASTSRLIITSPRGYALGGGHIGIGKSLVGESVHVPLIVLDPGEKRFVNCRSHALIQNSIVNRFIEMWCSQESADDDSSTDEEGLSNSQIVERMCGEIFMDEQSAPIFYAGANQQAVQNRFWKLIGTQKSEHEVSWGLFVKPDDRWDTNDVSTRCPQIVRELQETLDFVPQWT